MTHCQAMYVTSQSHTPYIPRPTRNIIPTSPNEKVAKVEQLVVAYSLTSSVLEAITFENHFEELLGVRFNVL